MCMNVDVNLLLNGNTEVDGHYIVIRTLAQGGAIFFISESYNVL